MPRKRTATRKTKPPGHLETIQLGPTAILLTYADESRTELSPQPAQWSTAQLNHLSAISIDDYMDHPQKGEVALLIAVANLQSNNYQIAASHIEQARHWGYPKKQATQLLINLATDTLNQISTLKSIKSIDGEQQDLPSKQVRKLAISIKQALQTKSDPQLAQFLNEITAATQNKTRKKVEPKLSFATLEEAFQFALQATDNLTELIHYSDTSQLLIEDAKHLLLTIIGNYYKKEKKDNLTAIHCHSLALKHADQHAGKISISIQALTRLNQASYALEHSLFHFITRLKGTKEQKLELNEQLNTTLKAQKPVQEHGHELLMKTIRQHLSHIRSQTNTPLNLIEIGSTREEVPGQGSTAKLASFCQHHQIHFITVDMDPDNTERAHNTLQAINPSFEAVTAKGEDYLQSYPHTIDFIFLDAYDFDHGNHSETRQQKYEQNLGTRINDADCHAMHLSCAQTLTSKLTPWGLIGFDDVWYQEGNWAGKGTTAVPFLLNKGFTIIASENRAIVLIRDSATASTP